VQRDAGGERDRADPLARRSVDEQRMVVVLGRLELFVAQRSITRRPWLMIST